MTQTIAQERAKSALDKVSEHLESLETADKTKDAKKTKELGSVGEFRAYAKSLPAMIHSNGLGQTMAFCTSKGGAYGVLYQITSDWLTSKSRPYQGKASVMDGITTEDMGKYRMAQAEALAYLDWVRKFAVAKTAGMSANETPDSN